MTEREIQQPVIARDDPRLTTGQAIVWCHDGIEEVVLCDALPKVLASYQRGVERAEAKKAERDAQKFLQRRCK